MPLISFHAAMPTKTKPDSTLRKFSPEEVAAALANAPEPAISEDIDWSHAVVTEGGGVEATLTSLRRRRGRNKHPVKEQVAIRFSPEVLAYFRAQGRGWQTRMDEVLKKYIESHTHSG
jgi:uncharacterized protein (DUF4415 family)